MLKKPKLFLDGHAGLLGRMHNITLVSLPVCQEELGSEVLRSSIQDLEEAPLSAPQEREIDPCYGHNSDRERQLGKENDWLPSGRRIK